MDIKNPRNITVQGYPILELELDGNTRRFDSEQKPTLVRHGLVALEGYSATLPNGQEVEATDDADLFRWVTAFGLHCYNGTFEEGEASNAVDRDAAIALGLRLAPFMMNGSPPWIELMNRLI